MRHKMFQAVPVIALALLLAVPVMARVEPKDPIDKQINILEAQIWNSLAKSKNDVGNVGTAPRGPVEKKDAKMSPAGRCCPGNLVAISEASGRLRKMFFGLRYQFGENQKREGTSAIRAMEFHLGEMEGRVKQFIGTGEKDAAMKFLELALLAIRDLREKKLDLDACCGRLLTELPTPGQAAGEQQQEEPAPGPAGQ